MFATNSTPTMITPQPGGELAENPEVRVYLSKQQATPLAAQAAFGFDAGDNAFVPLRVAPTGAVATAPTRKGRGYKARVTAKSGAKTQAAHPWLRKTELKGR